MESGSKDDLIVRDLKDVYSSNPLAAVERYRKISTIFVERYKCQPKFFARAPGRVNIIGEHIDYSGYSVLPMALEQDIVMAVATNTEKKLRISNTEREFSYNECDCNQIKIDGIEWFHYFLCGFKGICEKLGISNPVGMNIVVDGTIPKSAGLSSSSALVCCSGLATLYANNGSLSRIDLAEVCAFCERYIGTQGGGMDQSISFLAEVGKAKLIEFNPLRATNVALPNDSAFIIANCMVEMKKSETASTHFNVRVAECSIAAKVLAVLSGISWNDVRTLGILQTKLNKNFDQMLYLVETNLHKEPYAREEICSKLNINIVDFETKVISSAAKTASSFKLYERAVHVYSEAKRVLMSKEVCDSDGTEASSALGKLMNDSHDSCSRLYECSCLELDALVASCLSCGSLGSRLTGAGWGGCTVSIVHTDDVERFIRTLFDNYYATKGYNWDDVNQFLFSTQPGSGAALYLPTSM